MGEPSKILVNLGQFFFLVEFSFKFTEKEGKSFQ